ncbi:unnamed protein product [Nippostrongylus brasiliensis]|uniref:Secreted protein n=1 Tax=Nippostrongylus brasiliensis TaxID=27835 RepID=A0A0N4YE33_NIPBR|nr:unnamed protein product [Nippostrongylus brasiliensis]
MFSTIPLLLVVLLVRFSGAQSDSMDSSSEGPDPPIFEPLPALPDMTSVVRSAHPPGFAPPHDYEQKLRVDESMGINIISADNNDFNKFLDDHWLQYPTTLP